MYLLDRPLPCYFINSVHAIFENYLLGSSLRCLCFRFIRQEIKCAVSNSNGLLSSELSIRIKLIIADTCNNSGMHRPSQLRTGPVSGNIGKVMGITFRINSQYTRGAVDDCGNLSAGKRTVRVKFIVSYAAQNAQRVGSQNRFIQGVGKCAAVGAGTFCRKEIIYGLAGATPSAWAQESVNAAIEAEAKLKDMTRTSKREKRFRFMV